MPARNSTIRSACRDATVAVRPAVFLDRDGTIIEDVGNLHALEQIAFFPWSADAIRCLNSAGLPVVVITNQAGVARGLFTEQFVGETHARLSERLAEGGAHVDAYYYCPHHPGGTVAAHAKACDCRKPAGGLVDRAARDLSARFNKNFEKFTGVAREYWGQGVATALKLRAIEYAREHGYPTVRAFNRPAHAALLALNERLGFRRYFSYVTLERCLREVAKVDPRIYDAYVGRYAPEPDLLRQYGLPPDMALTLKKEGDRLIGGEFPGELQRFVDHHGSGRTHLTHFVDSQAQNIAIHRWHHTQR